MINSKDFTEGQLLRVTMKLQAYIDQPERLQTQVEDYFKEYDVDKSGNLDRRELKSFLIDFFKLYKIRLPITEEFVDTQFDKIDADGDGFVNMDELKSYLTDFLKTLLLLFNEAISEHPERLIKVDEYTLEELQVTAKQLEQMNTDLDKLKAMARDYFDKFDTDKSGAIEMAEMHNLIRGFFTEQGLIIPIDKNFIDDIFVDLDVDKSGLVEINELVIFYEGLNTILHGMYTAAIERKVTKK